MAQFAPKTILCPVDMSAASPAVLSWAGLFAVAYRAKVEILHADWIEYPPYFLPSQTKELIAMDERNRAALVEGLEKLARESLPKEVSYEIGIVEGEPVQTILKHAAEKKADLGVIGSHGRSGLARMRLGSVAEDVVQQIGRPTLVVRAAEGKKAPAKISRILCPVNFAEHTGRSLELSSGVAGKFGAQLVVLYADERGDSLNASQKKLCECAPAEVRDRCEWVEVVRQGDPAEQILLAAREHRADMITLVAKHRRFLDFTVIGTTAERVMRHADSAVLVHSAGIEVAE